MPDWLVSYVARHPGLAGAVLCAFAACIVAALVSSTSDVPPIVVFGAGLWGVAAAWLSGALFNATIGRRGALVEASATRLAELAVAVSQSDDTSDGKEQGFDPIRFEQHVTAIVRAYRSLERERAQSQLALEQQIARQSEFYARLSHELRSPLNAILGYASLALEDAEAGAIDDLPQDLRKIRSAGQNLLALIDNLLQLADDRTGRETVERVPFLLRDALTQVVEEQAQAATGAMVALEEGAGSETLFGNQPRVARAVGSVIDDAVRSRQATLVRISTRNSSTHDSCVEVVVDARNAVAQSSEASAMLTRHLADRLAAAAAGSLNVQQRGPSEWHYVLRLPLDIDRALISPPALRPIPLTQVPLVAPGSTRKSALIIDDDAATVELMSRWLERGGYDVRAASNAEDGLALAKTTRFDIVLLDALMPGRTGYDLLPDLTALPALRDTPVLIVTVDDNRSRGLAAGAADYVRKPITEGRLRDIISVYEDNLQGEVLIVEDDAESAELLERMVRRLGFSVRRATDGAEGLAALEGSSPVAILLDLNMPNLNGFELIDLLVQNEAYANIPLIVLSGQDLSVAQHHRLLASGCRYYMKGNAAPREIAATLREMVA